MSYTRATFSILVVAACSSSKSEPSATKEVTGTVMIDGKPVTITKCLVQQRMDTRLSFIFKGGSLAYEDDKLYLYEGDNKDGMMKGTTLTCSSLGGEQYWGTSTNEPGYARGNLAAECTAPKAVKLDVTLTCGTMTPEQEARFEESKKEMKKDMQDFANKMAGSAGSDGSAATGSAQGSAAGSAGSAH